MKAHLYGTAPYLPDASLLTADELAKQSGGNTGNLMFCHSLSRMLDTGNTSIFWSGNITHLSPQTDRLVLPLANQLGPHVDLKVLGERFSKVDIPMVGVGLGAQGPIGGIVVESIPEGSWDWLRTIISKAANDKPNIALRGDATHAAIASKGLGDYCVVTGCPSNFIHPSATLGREIYRRRANGLRRVVVAAGNPFLPQFKKLEQSLIKIVEQSEGLYVCQHPIDMLRLVKQEYSTVSPANFLKYKDYLLPDVSDDDFMGWLRRYGHSFTSVPEWLSFLNGFDLSIGTRIHGTMSAIQAGVPAVCLCIDSRTLELCKTMAVPYVDANNYRDGVTLEQMAEVLRQWDWRAYDETRLKLADRFVRFFQENDLEPKNALKELVKNRSKVSTAYLEKPLNAEVHQVSTASFDDRYRPIFHGLQRALGMVAPKILSYGCSDGYESNDLASKHFHHGSIVGCDIDEDALRISKLNNRFPSRVLIIKSEEEALRAHGPFDAVISMAVLCRWPDTANMNDISELYPFSKFTESIEFLSSLLRPGGLLCIYNANYLVSETPFAREHLELIAAPTLLPSTQPVRLFSSTGAPLKEQKLDGILFKKR